MEEGVALLGNAVLRDEAVTEDGAPEREGDLSDSALLHSSPGSLGSGGRSWGLRGGIGGSREVGERSRPSRLALCPAIHRSGPFGARDRESPVRSDSRELP